MKRKLLLALAGFLLVVGSVAGVQAQGDLLTQINDLRASKGLPPYTTNSALAGAALSQAQWMVNNGCAVAHVHPDGSTPRTRAASFGYPTVDVSENIYCGSVAGTNDAWVFWLNSGVHYAGLVNNRYKEIGIASASGAGGNAYVLVFGNPGGPAFVPPSVSGGGSGGPAGQPAYVLGLDAHGNILHEIQPGDTLGDIALIYGYTWGDIPGILSLNGLTQDDIRDLEIGAVLLVPPKAGTYTPTPGDPPTAIPSATPTAELFTETPAPENTPTAVSSEVIVPQSPTPAFVVGATSDKLPQEIELFLSAETATPSATPIVVADASMGTLQPAALTNGVPGVVTRSGTSPWLIVALVVQVGVLVVAGFEFIRRRRR
jgi:hypothetical protein